MPFIRARNEEQKNIRINQILDATAKLYESMEYTDITFTLIAKEADFTRSNLYKYFKNKEDIFIELLVKDLYAWCDEIIDRFSSECISAYSDKIDYFTSIWTDSLLNHDRMLQLLAIHFSVIEKKASFEYIVFYKERLVDIFNQITDSLPEVFHTFNKEMLFDFYTSQYAFISGFYPLTHLTEKQTKAFNSLESSYKIKEFSYYIKLVLTAYLKQILD